MIPRDYITAWREHAPWIQDSQVEQDLIISRALVEIFSHPHLATSLAFRGGTALYKLYIQPPVRYSEDIDLVQVRAEPIGATLDDLRSLLDPWLGKPKRRQNPGRVTLTYRFDSEDNPPLPLRLKIEINSREHFSAMGFSRIPFSVSSRWFSGNARVTTYDLNELLGTKLRALYQRKKGRDLFDLSLALEHPDADPSGIVSAFLHYMEKEGRRITRAMFEENLIAKIRAHGLDADIQPLLAEGHAWNAGEAAEKVLSRLVALLPGEPWRGY